MRTIWLFMLLIVVGCSQKEVSPIELKFDDGPFTAEGYWNPSEIKVVYHSGKKFSGTALDKYGNGQIMYTINFKNGLAHGSAEQFYPDGKPKIIQNFVKGTVVGEYKKYFENGNLQYESQMNDSGKVEGILKCYKEDGKLVEAISFINGKQNGPFMAYYDNGTVERKINYKDGKKEGTGETYFENGNVQSRMVYNNDKLNGEFTFFKKDGATLKGNWVNDELEGVISIYDKNGSLVRKTNNYDEINSFLSSDGQIMSSTKQPSIERLEWGDGHRYYVGEVQNEMPNGKGKLYKDGDLLVEGDWKDGQANGQVKIYDQGKLVYEGSVMNGVMHGKGKLYNDDGQVVAGVWDNGKYVEESSTSASRGLVIRGEELADNPQNYINKLITVGLVYTGALNDNLSLRCGDFESEEMARSAIIGFYGDNEKYYTRACDSNSGTTIYLRIPYDLRNSVPNMTSGILMVTGILKNKNTIIVRSVERLKV